MPFEFDAGATFSEQYTDNVFLTANDRRSDFITVFAPWMGLSYRAENFRLNLEASAEIARFAENSNEDYEDYFLGGEAQYRISDTVFAFGGLDYSLGHESRESPDDVNGSRPTELREASGYIGLGGKVADRNFRLGLNVRDLNYDDTPAALGVIDNDDRDRRQIEFGGRLGVASTENGELFVQGIYDHREYDQAIDNQGAGFQRSSKGYQAALGYTGAIGPMEGEVLLGLMSQDYDDPRFGTTVAVDLGADVTMPLGGGTELDAIVERSIEETTLSGASGYVSSSAGLRLRHRVASNMSLAAYGFLTQNDYQNLPRTDMLKETGLSLRYYFNPRLYLDTNYDFRQRQSDVAGADFDEHRITLRFGASLNPRFDKKTDNLAKAGAGGFYAGVQVGDNAMHTKVDGPRGAGGNLTADFGDHGLAGGVFAGYRREFGNLVLGAEVEAELNDTEWSHLAGRNFAVERGNAYALSGIAGLRTTSGNLLYGRFGVVSAEFDSTYQQGANPVVVKSDNETGLLFGVGAEIPFGNGLSGRMEYQLRAYDDYPIGSPMGTANNDNFANVESLARFGLVYAFGKQASTSQTATKADFSGLYAGAQLGHGTIQSDNSGPRPNSAAPAFTLVTTRAGQGFTGGLFAGYGVQNGRFYVGGEAEFELSSANWNVERSPTGRIYSAEKLSTVGLGVRVGYVLNDNVLLYGRAGAVRSEFDFDYTYGGAAVDMRETLDGIRIGAGIEFPVGKKTTARFDYTQTEYDANAVFYGQGTDRFDTSERLFHIGLTRQF
ncbi:outer membrane beta-barrel protein [Roseovarius bejariae]|nr:outer membrane beta-barrel protein [Roseovarius bejariae]